MTTYYVATLARYVLVDAKDEADARELGHVALHELYADTRRRVGKDVPINIKTVRPATDDEIELERWHQEAIAAATAQNQTDWTPMSVPGRENADGTETPTVWFAFNRATRHSVRFSSHEEAVAFCLHPDNQR